MRFMVIVKATRESEAGEMPSQQLFAEMTRYNEELAEAGVMLAGEGLMPSSRGVRVRFAGVRRTVTKGPFLEKDLIAGFWLMQTNTLEECIEWVKRCPNPAGEGKESEIEIRQIFETEDFGEGLPAELVEREKRLGEKVAENARR